jgi:hypothetical protein
MRRNWGGAGRNDTHGEDRSFMRVAPNLSMRKPDPRFRGLDIFNAIVV